MPLSDHEQKMLEAMERALYAEDPKFATQMNGRAGRGPSRQRLAIGIVAAIVGLGLVVFGVWTQTIIVGGIGFAVMVAGVAWAIHPGRPTLRSVPAGNTTPRGAVAPRRTPKQKTNASFMQRMEERWERRRRDGMN